MSARWSRADIVLVLVSLYRHGMAVAANHPPRSLGLGGDGDEIAAIAEVEQRFGVRLDYSDARYWTTVGDVYAALLHALPAAEGAKGDTWARFAGAISMETGVDPSRIEPETLLRGQHQFDHKRLLVVAVMIALTFAILRYW